MAIDYEKLGKRIKHFREQKGISQDELGNLVWVNNVHISNIETGKKAPSIDLLIELANALGISTDDLLVLSRVMRKFVCRLWVRMKSAGNRDVFQSRL